MVSSTVAQNSKTVNHALVKTPTGYTVSQPAAGVSYDRSARQYIVANGREIGRFPAGAENKTRAEWLALSYNDGRIYEAAQAMLVAGHDEKRTLRAAQIAFEGKVTERYHEGNYSRALVLGSEGNSSPVTGQGFYHVYHNIVWTCDCEDWEGRRESGERGHFCKHILAVMLLERLEGENEAGQVAIITRQVEHLQERQAARLASLAESCPQCQGRGTVNAVDTWTGRVNLMKCSCQIDF